MIFRWQESLPVQSLVLGASITRLVSKALKLDADASQGPSRLDGTNMNVEAHAPLPGCASISAAIRASRLSRRSPD